MHLRSSQNTIILIVVVQLMGCHACKEMMPLPYQYHFLEKIDLHPYHKIYHIGDTITLELTIPNKMMFDTLSKSLIRGDTLQFTFATDIGSLYNFPKPPPATNYFETITDKGLNYGRDTSGSAMNGSMSFLDNIECNNDSDYHYSVGLIARAKGIYYFYFSFGAVSVCPFPTNPAFESDISYQFNLADCNMDILSTIPSTDLTASLTREAAAKSAFILQVDP